MRDPLKIGVIGCGKHSLSFHLPALLHYQQLHPDTIVLAGIVDPEIDKARAAAAQFSFRRAYTSIDDMLRHEEPNACLALTPVALNAATAIKLMHLGMPVLMEKPMGKTLAQAREVCRVAAETNARIMVSMNRRFDPQAKAALAWIAGRELRYLRVAMTRVERCEPRFLEETGVHVVDMILALGGKVARWSSHRNSPQCGSAWTQIDLDFENGSYGTVDLLPTTGVVAEVFELFGNDFNVEIRSTDYNWGWRAWHDGKLVRDEMPPAQTPDYIANGTYAETAAFIDNIISGGSLYPTPSDALASIEICLAAGSIAQASSANQPEDFHPSAKLPNAISK